MRWGLRCNQISIYDRAVSSLDFLVKEHRKSHYLLTREKKTVTWDKTVSINWDRQIRLIAMSLAILIVINGCSPVFVGN